MIFYKKNYPKCDSYVSLCDKRLTRIYEEGFSVVFEFADGIDFIDNGDLKTTDKALVKINNCKFADFDCYIYQRKYTRKGLKFSGKHIDLSEISNRINEKFIPELYMELYDNNIIHWQFIIYSCKIQKRPFPSLILKLNKDYSIEYYW